MKKERFLSEFVMLTNEHDVNNDSYKGAAKAVEQFSLEHGISFLPIPDSYGSVVFIKN